MKTILVHLIPLLLLASHYAAHAEDQFDVDAFDNSDTGDLTKRFEDYKQPPGDIGFQQSDCDESLEDLALDTHKVLYKYSCRSTRLGRAHYGEIHKYVALACRKGYTETDARFAANAAAGQLIFSEYGKAKVYFNENGVIGNVREKDHCVKVGSENPDPPPHDIPGPPSPVPDIEIDPPPHPDDEATIKFINKDSYPVGVVFYSQLDSGAWPGENQQYSVTDGDSESFKLTCQPGEQICYGAWRDGQDVSWGVGRRNEYACKSCCTVCGKDTSFTIGHGGPPKGPPPAVFNIHNNDRYKVSAKFFSQTKNLVWPGANNHYTVERKQTYRFSCETGEKICYGAWREFQLTYWGAGKYGRQNCERCCTTCGNVIDIYINDGGNDDFGSEVTDQGPGFGNVPDDEPPPSHDGGGGDDSGGRSGGSQSDITGGSGGSHAPSHSTTYLNDALTTSQAISNLRNAARNGGGGYSRGPSSSPVFRPAPRSTSTITGIGTHR